jgi:hypothetical protein
MTDHPLSLRYEIRKLTLADAPAARAIICHANSYHSPLWTPSYGKKSINAIYENCQYFVEFQIKQGHCFGAFDTQYKYKTIEAQEAGGKLLWDLSSQQADPVELLAGMDFPLASIALAYDQTQPMDMQEMGGFFSVMPEFPMLFMWKMMNDSRPDNIKHPRGPNDVMARGGTATRADYENRGLSRYLAEYEMRYAAKLGFRAISIVAGSVPTAVQKVWENPPAPFKSTVIAEAIADEIKVPNMQTGGADLIQPFPHSKQVCKYIWCQLKPEQ